MPTSSKADKTLKILNMVKDGKLQMSLGRIIKGIRLNIWPTPRANEEGAYRDEQGRKKTSGLKAIIQYKAKTNNNFNHNMWPTITANTSKNISNGIDWEKRLKKGHLDGVIKAVEGSMQLNPDWAEWLMGWIIGWTSLKPIKKLLWLDWNVDPANDDLIPRIATNIRDKTNRLQAIGNGQVPQCMVKAFKILSSNVIIN
jgi:hypothetical protein